MATEKVVVSFRLSPEEYADLERTAESGGESISEYVRRAVVLRMGIGTPIRILPTTSLSAPFTQLQLTVPTPNVAQPVPLPETARPEVVVQEDYSLQV